MSNIVKVIVLAVIAALIVSVIVLRHNNVTLKKDLSNNIATIKAYSSENSTLKNEARVFQLSIDQLHYYNDSILQKMDDARKELGIKDKRLESLQYMLSVSSKRDTIKFRDTLFKEPTLAIDTLMGDRWYQLGLFLKYPNTIVASPRFISEKHVIISSKKETINPPKKFFLFRWFQKKHTILKVNIVEKNPYIKDSINRFIKIIK